MAKRMRLVGSKGKRGVWIGLLAGLAALCAGGAEVDGGSRRMEMSLEMRDGEAVVGFESGTGLFHRVFTAGQLTGEKNWNLTNVLAGVGEWQSWTDAAPGRVGFYKVEWFDWWNEVDSDEDGLPDSWEVRNGFNPLNKADGGADDDKDGLTNDREYHYKTCWTNSDSDWDGMPDGWEVKYWEQYRDKGYDFNPMDEANKMQDPDEDELLNFEECREKTDPGYPDTDRDGLPDGWEVKHRNLDLGYDFSPTNSADGDLDYDEDGLSNADEYLWGTDFDNPDCDGDGLNDGKEWLNKTDPRNPDTDSDGLPDKWEVDHSLNPVSDGGTNYGLVARWTFDERHVVTNRAGGEWTGKWNASLTGGMSGDNWTNGRCGGALRFNGDRAAPQYVFVPETGENGGVVLDGGPFTVTWVCKIDAKDVLPNAALGGEMSDSDTGWHVRLENDIYGNPNGLWWSMGAGPGKKKQGQLLTNNAALTNWTDVALTWDGSNAWGYVNGKEVGKMSNVVFSPAGLGEIRIGACKVNETASYWKGWIDDVRIYRRSLSAEEIAAVNDWLADPDGDGLTNGRELELGTNPTNAYSDADTLTDGWEVEHGLDPLSPDSDRDGMPDDWEVEHELDPRVEDADDADADQDGLPNLLEYQCNSDPWNPDSNGDGLVDGWKWENGLDPMKVDSDGDGLDDKWEVDNGFMPPSDGGTNYGLVAWWKMDGTLENSADTNKWRGIPCGEGETVWTNGRGAGLALWLDGSNQYVSVAETNGDGPVLDGGPFTVTWVCKLAEAEEGEPVHAALGGEMGPSAGWQVCLADDGSHLEWRLGNGSETAARGLLADVSVLADWTDVALAWDGTNAWGFVNGKTVGKVENAKFSDAGLGEILIGACLRDGELHRWKGWIDDVRIYRKALSEEELWRVNDWLGDADGDGLTNGQEYGLGTKPGDKHSDGDGLEDGLEVAEGLNPLSEDTDGDGLPDDWEWYNGLDANSDGGRNYGLVAWWKLDGDLENAVTNKWAGQLSKTNEAPVWGTEEGTRRGKGTSLRFDGKGQFVRVPLVDGDARLLEGRQPFTVTWVCKYEPDGAPANASLGGDSPADSDRKGWTVRFRNGGTNLVWIMGEGNGAKGQGLTNAMSLTNWTDVALAWDGTNAWGYVNGKAVGNLKVDFAETDGGQMMIGASPLNETTSYWKGWIDDVRMFGTALTEEELGLVNDWLGDADRDGLPNGREWEKGTNPTNAYSDTDTLTDGWEVAHGLNPLHPDTDGDGMPDDWEVEHGLDPLVDDTGGDADGDGLSNGQEWAEKTDPDVVDTDGDGLTDGDEVERGTKPKEKDSDGDLMEDGWEVDHELNPLANDAGEDADGDGLSNGREWELKTNPQKPDTDDDGLTDWEEVEDRQTDPLNPDSDGDGLPDGWEWTHGLSPRSDGGTNYDLVAWWKLDEDLLNAVDSNKWAGRMGVTNEPLAWEEGRARKGKSALWFDGKGQYVKVPETDGDGRVLDGGPFTVAWVCKYERNGAPANAALGGEMDSEGKGWRVRFENGGTTLWWSAGAGSGSLTKQGGVANADALTNWTDVALTWDGSNAWGYVNGKAVGTMSNVVFAPAGLGAIQIGATSLNHDSTIWKGWIDDVKIYRKSLSADEIVAVNDWLGDADGDGLPNGREWELGTNPTNAYSDADSLTDGWEVEHGLNPLHPDTDGDGMPDDWEVEHELDPRVKDADDADADQDGLSNLLEYQCNSDPWNPDSNGDGMPDGWKWENGLDPMKVDSDGDGLDDKWEVDNGFMPPSDGGTNYGLVAWWKMDGSLENSVDTNKWRGIPCGEGETVWTNGRGAGLALWLDGSNQYVSVAETNGEGRVLDGGPFTVTWVCKLAEAEEGEPVHAALGGEMGPSAGWQVCLADDGSHLEWRLGNGSETAAQVLANAMSLTNWTDVALAWDGTNAWGYVNGKSVGKVENAKFSDAGLGEILIGAYRRDGEIHRWKGWIDDVRIYRKALSEEELGLVNDWLGDADRDGLTNGQEYELGTNPGYEHSDGDGLEDGWEVANGLNPLSEDTDGDGLPDDWEWYNGLDANSDGGRKYGLVAWWKLDGNLENAVTNKWAGRMSKTNEAPVWGKEEGTRRGKGTALRFDGKGQFVRVPLVDGDVRLLEGRQPFTVTWVCKYEMNGAPLNPSLGGDSDSDKKGWTVRFRNGGTNLVWIMGEGNGAKGQGLTNAMSLTNWTDVALAWDGTNAWGYVNGKAVGNLKVDFAETGGGQMMIGASPLNETTSYWKGWIDDVRMFGTALTEEELGLVNDWLGDADQDGLTNGREYERGTNPTNAYSDTDTLTDGWEVEHGLNPLHPDTDGDGMPDDWEVEHGLDPLVDDTGGDADGDGLSNGREWEEKTYPNVVDTDGDGLTDWEELEDKKTEPLNPDSDGDGMWDGWEVAHGLNPRADDAGIDADGDGLSNGREWELKTNPQKPDTDDDGLDDGEEVVWQTDPLNPDSDGDGLPDGWEVEYKLNPKSDGGTGTNYNLAAWWKLDGDLLNAVDTNKWPGLLCGGGETVWTNGRGTGRALWLDGKGQFIKVSETNGDGTVLNWEEPFTLTWLCKYETNGVPKMAALGGAAVDNKGGWWVRFRNGSQDLYYSVWGYRNNKLEVGQAKMADAAELSDWTDVALVWDGTNACGYVNGRKTETRERKFVPADLGAVWIGGCNLNQDASCWKGWIDDVRFFQQALTAEQLAEVNDWLWDPDEDGLTNAEEWKWGTNPRDTDSDRDHIPDKWEVEHQHWGFSPTNGADGIADWDYDGLLNWEEYEAKTDPWKEYSDGDTLNDYEEVKVHKTDPLSADTDSDGLDDAWEVRNGTDPLSGMHEEMRPLVWLTFDAVDGSDDEFLANRAGETNVWAETPSKIERIIDGHRGGALRLNGSNFLYLMQPEPGTLLGTNGYTVSMWVRSEEMTSGIGTLLNDFSTRKGSDGNEVWRGMEIREEPGNNWVKVREGTTVTNQVANVALWKERWRGQWTHLAVVHDREALRMYLDGSLYVEIAGAATVTTNQSLYLGCGRGVNGQRANYWKGAVDDVRIFGKALSRKEIETLVEAEIDSDLTGISNLAKWLYKKELSTSPLPPESEGSLDMILELGEGTPEGVHWLGRYNGLNPGSEAEVYLRGDDLHFELHDGEGRPHAIRIMGVTSNGYLTAGTNRVTASWRGFDGTTNGADMRLYLNGVDVYADGIWRPGASTPKLTGSSWRSGVGYQDAAWTEGTWGERNGEWWRGSRHQPSNRNVRAAAKRGSVSVDGEWKSEAYGIPGEPFLSDEELATEKSKHAQQADGQEPRVLVQDMLRPGAVMDYVAPTNIAVAIKRYRQFTDSLEYAPRWTRGEKLTNYWGPERDSLKIVLDQGKSNGVGIAMSGHLWWKQMVCLADTNWPKWPEHGGEFVRVTTNGTELVLSLEETVLRDSQGNKVAKLVDRADQKEMAEFTKRWTNALAEYPGYEYYFLNETALTGIGEAPWEAATYSAAALKSFRNYTRDGSIKFPLPALPSMLTTNGWEGMTIRVDEELAKRAEMTRDPAVWAKWWEWREVVLAKEIAEYGSKLAELNKPNTNWHGMVLFVSPALAFTRRSGLNLELLAKVKGLDWMVMENTRLHGYGDNPEDLEEEVRLQLAAAKGACNRGTAGFGSYVMVHAYPYPDTNGVTNATYKAQWVSNDVEWAVNTNFQSKIIVPYSAVMLMDRPQGTTTNWQNAHYEPEMEDLWLNLRYTKLRSPPTNLHVLSLPPPYKFQLVWDPAKRADEYEVQVARDESFTDLIVSNAPVTGGSVRLEVELREPVFWRVRAVYFKRSFTDEGMLKDTKKYYGNWSTAQKKD